MTKIKIRDNIAEVLLMLVIMAFLVCVNIFFFRHICETHTAANAQVGILTDKMIPEVGADVDVRIPEISADCGEMPADSQLH